MLGLKYYSVHEIEDLKDFFLVSYVIIDDIYHRIILDSIRFMCNYTESKLSDSEIITLVIVGEIYGISSYGYCASKKETYYRLNTSYCDK